MPSTILAKSELFVAWWLLLGALVLAGVGVLLWLIFRRRGGGSER